jgi:hypothetical protein
VFFWHRGGGGGGWQPGRHNTRMLLSGAADLIYAQQTLPVCKLFRFLTAESADHGLPDLWRKISGKSSEPAKF